MGELAMMAIVGVGCFVAGIVAAFAVLSRVSVTPIGRACSHLLMARDVLEKEVREAPQDASAYVSVRVDVLWRLRFRVVSALSEFGRADVP